MRIGISFGVNYKWALLRSFFNFVIFDILGGLMNDIQLIVLVCMECSGIYAVQAEWLDGLEDDEVAGCYYCGSAHTCTLVSNAMEVS